MGLKINLGCAGDIRAGYINIDKVKTHPAVIEGDFMSLSNIAPACADELLANQCLQHVPWELGSQTLQIWASKLEKGGTLFVEAPDINMISTAMHYDQAQVEHINQALFGPPNDPYKGIYNLHFVESTLQRFGLETIEKGYNGPCFYIRMRKI